MGAKTPPFRMKTPPFRMPLLLSLFTGAAALTAPTARTSRYVNELLNTVQSTDRGVKASAEQRQIVDGLVARLERSYEGTVAADSPEWLYRECEVAYVGQRSSRKANAAGGRFRGRVGRLLFRTTAMYQHVLYHSTGNLAINFIKFRLLGLLPGSVVLRGAVEPEADREALGARWNRTLSENTIRAAFRSPRVAFGPLTLDLGPTSEVRLDTTYLDDRIRVSRGGSSGTVFVFKACDAEDATAGDWKAVVARKPTPRSALAGGFGAAAATAAALRAWVPCAAFALLAAKLITSTGGIVVDRAS